MSTDQAEGPRFAAGRDITGAFATGAGAKARSIGTGTYIENYFGPGVQPRQGPIHYGLPSLPDRYQPREADVALARARLLGAGAAVGLRGMGGIGKTVLASALVQPSEAPVRAAFPDGIAWLTFGRTAPVLAKAAELAFALTGTPTSFGSLSEARGQLGLLSADRRLLVVLDDVWEPAAVDPFTGLGAGCRLLITSRDLRVLERAQADAHRLDLLDAAAARAFLAEAAGQPVAALPDEAEEIVRETGRLPLALAAVGALIRQGTYRWSDALAALREGAVDELDTGWLPDPEQRNLAVVLKLSVDGLADEVRDCLLDCAAFREDADIPEATLLRLWSPRLPERRGRLVAQELVDRSLMQRDEQRRYRIHDLHMDYLRHLGAPLVPRHRSLIERYREASEAGWTGCPDDGYCVQHIAWHLRQAEHVGELRPLLFDPGWMRRKLSVAGLHALLDDYGLLAGDPEASRLAAALTLSGHVLGADPGRLVTQLRGRLLEEDGPAITTLLAALQEAEPDAFHPINGGYLNPPGALLRTIPLTAPVVTVAAAGSGRHALSGSRDGWVRLWDLESGAEVRRFAGDGGSVRSIAVLGDGRRALAGYRDGVLRLWDLASGTALRRFDGHEGGVRALAMLPGDRRALSGSDDGTLRLWDLESGTELRRLETHGGAIRTVAVLPDGRRALFGSEAGSLRLWDLEGGTELRRFAGHGLAVWTIATLPDGSRALSGSLDGTLRLWDLESGAELRRFVAWGGSVRSVAVLDDGRSALCAYREGILRLWDLETGAELRRFEGHGRPVNTVAMLADGRHAVSGSWDGTVRLWDLKSGAERRGFAGHGEWVGTLAILGDRRHALSGSRDGTLRLWDLASGAEQRAVSIGTPIVSVAVAGEGLRALSGSRDGTVRLWDLQSGTELRRFQANGGSVRSIALSADQRRVLSGHRDGSLRLWDLDAGDELHRFHAQGGPVTTVAMLEDGRRALSGSLGGSLRLWDLERGDELHRFVTDGSAICTVAILHDGLRALTASNDGTLRLWDLNTGTELRRLEGHSLAVWTVGLLGDGRRALSGSLDGTVRLWDLERGVELRRFTGHRRTVTKVALLDDGCRALSGSLDGTLRLWDLESGEELACFAGDDAITAIEVAHEEWRAVVGDARGRVMILPVPGGPIGVGSPPPA